MNVDFPGCGDARGVLGHRRRDGGHASAACSASSAGSAGSDGLGNNWSPVQYRTRRARVEKLCAVKLRARRVCLALLVALVLPGAASAHDVNTPAGHQAEDAVVTTRRPRRGSTIKPGILSPGRRHRPRAAAAVAADPGQVGEWGPVVDWPVVGIHVALLPNGKVLAWDSVGDAATETLPVHDFTRATVYDPVTGVHTPATVDTGYNIFCAGFAHLSDGSLFLAGGNKNAQLQGIVQTHLFNPANNGWSLGPNMAAGRWYPSVTPLTNGEMLITEGGPDTPEVRKTDGTLRTLSTATLNLPLYPWLDVAPDGRVFYSGPDQTLRKLDPAGGGSWQSFGQRDGINRELREPRRLRHRQDARGRRRLVVERRARDRHQRSHAPGLRHLADGLRPSPAQPDAARRRERPRDGRQLDRRGAHRHERRRLQRGAVGPRDRSVDDPRGAGGDAPVPLDRVAAPRRPRALLGRRHLRHLRPGRLSGEERRGLHAAVSVQEGRFRPARTAARDHGRAGHGQPRHVLPDHHAERRFDPEGRR